MTNRRQFTTATLGALLATRLGAAGAAAPTPPVTWRMPDEGDPHCRTWMAFGAARSIWGGWMLESVRADIGRIARTIAQFEPVTVLARRHEMDLAADYCGSACAYLACDLNDIWARDTGCVFVHGSNGAPGGVNLHFNGWGRKQVHGKDAGVAARMARAAGATEISAGLVMEGGGLEVDGLGTAILTESCILNRNRNPGMTKAQAEAALAAAFGITHFIWLPGIKGRDITDAHVDFYARFVAPGVVVAHRDSDPSSYDQPVTQTNLDILRRSVDAAGRPLTVVVLDKPTRPRAPYGRKDLAAGYVNFYLVNGGVIAPQFGNARADANAEAILRELLPTREVVMLPIDAVAGGGGGIHCVTQQEPL